MNEVIDAAHLLQLMFGGVIVDWQSYPSLAQASSVLAATLADIVKAGQDSGELRAGALEELTLTAWSLVHGLALLLVGKRIPEVTVDLHFVRHASRRCVTLLVEGLRAHPDASPGRARR